MKAQDIYTTYNTMPTLQLHMLRVGAVAQVLCGRLHGALSAHDARAVISACLVHDMGNLIKFDLDRIPAGLDLGGTAGVAYWKQEQEHMRRAYGTDEHVANASIIRELALSPQTQYIAAHIGTAQAAAMFRDKNVPVLMATYCDFRVTPSAVVPLSERINDLLHRYASSPKGDSYRQTTVAYEHIERWFHEHFSLDTNLDPHDIEALVPTMRAYEVV